MVRGRRGHMTAVLRRKMHQRYLWCDVAALRKVYAKKPETKMEGSTQALVWRLSCKEAGVNLLKG